MITAILSRALPPWAKLAALAALVAAVAGWGYVRGARSVQAAWSEERINQSVAVVRIQARQALVTERVVTQYVDRVRVVRETADAIIREVPVYVPQSCDADGRLPAGWRVLHDAAASGQPADAARAADAQPVAPDAAAETVARNYLTCRETAEQLTALQQWVREQAAVQP